MYSYRMADPRRPTTYLKVGSSIAPNSRYRPSDKFWIPEGNIIAVTRGYSQNVREVSMNILIDKDVCANFENDFGQYPGETEEDVYYYIAEKK